MRRTWFAVLSLFPALAVLCVAQQPGLPNPPPATPAPAAAPITPPGPADDEQTLKDAKVGVDGPALLAYFQQHTTPPDQQERIHGLIGQLGDDSYKVPQGRLGRPGEARRRNRALPAPRLTDPDEEIKERAESLMKNAEGTDSRAAQSAAAARLLRQRAPGPSSPRCSAASRTAAMPSAPEETLAVLAVLAGHEGDAAPVLLAYVPDADTDAVEDEVIASLAVLGVHDGKVDAAVVTALKDKVPSRRAAAAVVLGRSGTSEQRSRCSHCWAIPTRTSVSRRPGPAGRPRSGRRASADRAGEGRTTRPGLPGR